MLELERLDHGADVLHRARIERDEVGEAVHESGSPAVLADHDGIARQERAPAIGAVGPMEHRAAGEMAAAADEREARGDLPRVAVPEHDRAIVPDHPVGVVGVEVDGNVAQCAAPLDHARVEMRVGDRDAGDAPTPAHRRHSRFVHQADAIPQEPAGAVPHVERPLPDAELRIGPDPGQPRRFGLDAVSMAGAELIQRGPPLALPADVLPVLAADEALLGRDGAVRVLGAAGDADEGWHRGFRVGR
jgi:hypothetical protein